MKKLISILFVICLLSSLASIAFADFHTDILVTAPAESFNVTVPTQLPVTINADGSGQTANGYIKNNSSSTISVTNVTLKEDYGWKYTTGKFANQRQFNMTINNVEPSNAASAIGTIVAGESKTLNYSITIPKQHTALKNAKIASVIFTIGWTDSGSDLPYAIDVKKYCDTTTDKNWLSVASYGDYTLLLIETPTGLLESPAFSNCVGNTDTANYCKPIPLNPASAFDLSKDEYLSYCVGLPAVGEFNLRDNGKSVNYQGIVNESNDSTMHRSAVWILSSSLSSYAA